MKTLYFILFIFAMGVVRAQNIPCFNGISTNPENPINPNPPDPDYLNQFDWSETNGFFLAQYAIHDMYEGTNINYIMNPYSDQNNYSYLTNPGMYDLDMYWENGWELLSVNLGAYPSGTLLSERNPPEQTAYTEIPYLLLYNKQRGIIRLFANSLTGLDSPYLYDAVRVELRFNHNNLLSGLLRHNDGYDRSLDQSTVVKSVGTFVNHPNNPSLWFHADFQVGYDPCTCLFRSDLSFEMTFFDSQDLSITSNGLYVNVPLLDPVTNQLAIDPDFLTGVNYQDGFAGSGLVIYKTMGKMVDDYIARLEFVKQQNELTQVNNDKIERKLTILKVFKDIVIGQLPAVITGNLALSVSSFATELIQVVNGDGSVKIKEKELEKMASQVLGQGFDWLSKEVKKDNQDMLKAPTMPTATLSQTTFAGEIQNMSAPIGPTIFNPGTYPSAEGIANATVNAHNYPIYNEVLGLFAVLNKPTFKRYYDSPDVEFDPSWVVCPDVELGGVQDGQGAFDILKELTYDITVDSKVQYKLAEPLKLAFNPAAGIDFDKTTVEACLVVHGDKIVKTPAGTTNIIYDSSPFCTLDYSSASTAKTFYTKNFIQEEGHEGTGDLPSDIQSSHVMYSTPFVPLDVFNEMVSEINYGSFQHWEELLYYEGTGFSPLVECPDFVYFNISTPIVYDNLYTGNAAYTFQLPSNSMVSSITHDMMALENVKVEFKLLFEFHFLQPGFNDSENVVSQISTFRLDETNFVISTSVMDIPFNLTQDVGGFDLPEYRTMGDEVYDFEDFLDYPTYPADAPLFGTYHVSAWNTVSLTGDQSHSDDFEVEFIGGQQVVASGELTIYPGITLKLGSFWTSSPTPMLTSDYVEDYCQGLVAQPYQANQSAFTEPGSEDQPWQINYRAMHTLGTPMVYPNPASTYLNIVLHPDQEADHLLLFDALGKQVLKLNSADIISKSISIDGLSSGIYTLRFDFTDGSYSTVLFTVFHS